MSTCWRKSHVEDQRGPVLHRSKQSISREKWKEASFAATERNGRQWRSVLPKLSKGKQMVRWHVSLSNTFSIFACFLDICMFWVVAWDFITVCSILFCWSSSFPSYSWHPVPPFTLAPVGVSHPLSYQLCPCPSPPIINASYVFSRFMSNTHTGYTHEREYIVFILLSLRYHI